MDVMTTLNARELMLIIRLRTCTRAQWEIRHVAMGLLRLLREQYGTRWVIPARVRPETAKV